jgi:hypothetical protein
MKQRLTAAAVILTVTFFCSCVARADPKDLKAELVRLNEQAFAAFDKGDIATVDRMEAPNLITVNDHGTGEIWKKKGLGRKLSPSPGVHRTFTDVTVRQFGETAILTAIETTKSPGSADTARESMTQVWVREAGNWLIASMQWSELTPAK